MLTILDLTQLLQIPRVDAGFAISPERTTRHGTSITLFLDRVSAPVQLICGGKDPRCPASDSLDARDKLVELGKEVESILYEDDGPVFLSIDNVIHFERMRVELLAEVLET